MFKVQSSGTTTGIKRISQGFLGKWNQQEISVKSIRFYKILWGCKSPDFSGSLQIRGPNEGPVKSLDEFLGDISCLKSSWEILSEC